MPWARIFLLLAGLLSADGVGDSTNLSVHASTNRNTGGSALGNDCGRIDEVEAVADRYIDLFAAICIGVLCN